MITEKKYNFDDYTTIAILGQKGSGKTQAMKIMFQEEKKKAVFFDLVGKTKIPGKDILYISNVQKVDRDEINAVFRVWKKAKKIILDLSALNSKQIVLYSDIFFRKLLVEKVNCAVYIDEIAECTPQQRKKSEETIKMIRIGRNYGILPVVFSTQRPQQVAKNVLALADVYIVMRIVYPSDRKIVADVVGIGQDHTNFLAKMKTRDCIIWGYKDKEPVYTKIKEKII